MLHTVQELAQRYAQALVRYHAAKIARAQGAPADEYREAQNDLFVAYELLDTNAIRSAEIQMGLVEN